MLYLTGGLDSSSGFTSSSSFGAEDGTIGVSAAGVPSLVVGGSSQGFKNKDCGDGDDDGGVVGDEEEECLRVSASSLSRLQLSRAI